MRKKNLTYETVYRKRRDEEVWHWCRNCNRWPREDYEVRHGPPGVGQLCDECKHNEKNKMCDEMRVSK